MYTQIDGKWPEPTKENFHTMAQQDYRCPRGFSLEDMHWWWRHLPEELKYTSPVNKPNEKRTNNM
jgi:hypothetical protein